MKHMKICVQNKTKENKKQTKKPKKTRNLHSQKLKRPNYILIFIFFNDSFYSYHIQSATFLILIFYSLYLSLKQWKIDSYDFYFILYP